MMLKRVVFFVAFLVFIQVTKAQSEDFGRYALVIGNATYKHVNSLDNSAQDARLIGETLRSLDFDVTVAIDLDKRALQEALLSFRQRVSLGSVVVVFFAGHGIQYDGENYLVPTDARFTDVADLPFVTLPVNQMLEQIKAMQASSSIVILDACRNNPLYSGNSAILNSRSATGSDTGLARQASTQVGSLIAFSTGPGEVALDGDKGNSPYSLALSKALTTPGLTIEQVFKKTRAEVVKVTNGHQIPWENSSLVSAVMLAEPAVPVQQRGRLFNVATPCDIAAAHPSDPERVGPAVEYANLDPQMAVPACEQAVRDFPENPRFKALLARALDKARRGSDAYLMNQAAMEQEYIAAWHNMGNLYAKGLGVEKDLSRALDLWLYAAERGHAEDQSNVGRAYLRGRGTEVDYDKARYWLERAAEQNWSAAINWLGIMALNGQGMPQDNVKSFEYFKRATNLGFRHAMVNLGNAYRDGIGTEQNYEAAVHFYTQAARLRTPSAYRVLAHMAENGLGREKSVYDAAFWYTLAARRGGGEDFEAMQRARSLLSAVELDELDLRLQDWDEHDFG